MIPVGARGLDVQFSSFEGCAQLLLHKVTGLGRGVGKSQRWEVVQGTMIRPEGRPQGRRPTWEFPKN